MPPVKAKTTTPAPVRLEDLTPEQRDELLSQYLEEQRQRALPPEARRRELTMDELVIRRMLRERDHLEACPIVADPERAVGRVEAYNEVKPANPARGIPAQPVTVARCIECGGSRLLEGTLEANKITTLRELGGGSDAGDELDVNLA